MEQVSNQNIEETPLLVTIRCFTYNHEPYIRQCLEGFVMQKTNFRFEAIVHDDASTDGTADIIREYAEKYPDIIKPILEVENQYSKHDGSLTRIMNAHTYGKYIAMCEGDDYWTDPLKLQKQVDFLESHDDYGMCYTRVVRFVQKSGKYEEEWGGSNVLFEDLLIKNTIPTLTCLIRKDLYEVYKAQVRPDLQAWKMGDYPMWLWFSHESKIAFMPIVTGVYRVLENSASHLVSLDKHITFNLSGLDIKQFYNKLFKTGISDRQFQFWRWCIYLRSYAIFSEWKKFCILWIKGIIDTPSYLLKLSSYKYFFFFFSKRARLQRM